MLLGDVCCLFFHASPSVPDSTQSQVSVRLFSELVDDILGRSGHGDEMLRGFAYVEEVDIVPDFISYSTSFEGLEDLMCLLYLRKMVESGVEPDLLAYTALVDSFGPSGNVEASLELYRQMKMTKIHPSVYIYQSLIAN